MAEIAAFLNPAGWHPAVLWLWFILGGMGALFSLGAASETEDPTLLLLALAFLALPYTLLLLAALAVPAGAGWLGYRGYRKASHSLSEEAKIERRIRRLRRDRELLHKRKQLLQEENELWRELQEVEHAEMPLLNDWS